MSNGSLHYTNGYPVTMNCKAKAAVYPTRRKCWRTTPGGTALKAKDPMKWVGLMNTLKAQAEEIIFSELSYV